MAVSDWSTTAGSNTTVGAVNIAENCSPANVNNGLREIMAQVKAWSVGLFTASGFTMTTSKLLGRSTASTGAVEEITIGAGLTLSGGTLSASATLPAGTVIAFAASTAPSGYLECDGSAVSRTTYADLFAAVGTTWGAGNGSTTFNLPDLRGEFLRGYDNGRGVDSGRAFASSQSSQMQAHTHSYSRNIDGGSGYPGGSGGSLTTSTTGSAGGTTNSSENRPRNIAIMFCIKS